MDTNRAGVSRSEARGNISLEGPIGPENTSGGIPLEIWPNTSFYTSVVDVLLNCIPLSSHNTIQFRTTGPLLYLLGPGVSNPAYPSPPPLTGPGYKEVV